MTNQISKQKEKIISTAEGLLARKGYDNTSVNEVIKETGIAKGTFYHYFDSKESLFDGIIARLSDQALKPIKKIVDNPSLSAIDKFNSMIDFAKKYKLARKKIYRALSRWIFNESNIRLRQKLINYYSRFIVPDFEKIIKQGIQEKSFNVGNPRLAADMIIQLAVAAGEKLWPLIITEKVAKNEIKLFEDTLNAYNEAIERILGVKPGQLNIFESRMIEKFFAD